MDHPLRPTDSHVHPWRTAAFVAGAVAAVELVLLVIVGGALLAKPEARAANRPVVPVAERPAHTARTQTAPRAAKAAPPAAARLSRSKVSVLVLNGNGVTGAAARAAERVSRHGYRIGGVANAPRSDFTRNLVMYRGGFAAEGARLADDLRIKIVGPLDGLKPRDLKGAQVVLVVGG